MPDVTLSEVERRVLSYCSRGVNKAAAEEKIGEFFGMRPMDVKPILEKLKRQGLVIEAKGPAGIAVYQTSPLKVRSSMLDQRVVVQMAEMERGTKAGGFKKKTFDPDTGIVTDEAQPKPKVREAPKKSSDLGFDLND